MDDGFDPDRSVSNAKVLIEQRSVRALLLTRGTANAEALLPLLAEKRVPLLAPVALSRALHEPPQRYVFNLRPPASAEARRIVDQITTMGYQRVAILYTDDAFGKDALEGAKAGLAAASIPPSVIVPTPRGEPKVEDAVEAILRSDAQVVMGLCIAKTCAEAVRQLRAKRSTVQFVTLSNTSSAAFVEQLGAHARGVMVAQVFPNPVNASTALAREFQALAKIAGLPRTYSSMEGFVAAKIMVEALRRAGTNPDPDAIVKALETLRNHDIGGFQVRFGPGQRSGSAFVELSLIGASGDFVR